MRQLSGLVISGRKLGKKIGFPTANLPLRKPLKIRRGVYTVLVTYNQQNYLGLAFYGQPQLVEVYLFNFKQNLYGEKLIVKLLDLQRPPQRIKNLNQLSRLIKQDITKLNDQVILVNKQDRIIGLETKLKAHQGRAKLHRAVSVQLFNHKGEWLLQQRSKAKLLFPLFWANTVCTDVRSNETYQQAAQRRLQEEFGLTAQLKPVFKFSYTARWREYSEREIDQVFIGTVSGQPRPNPQEINAWQFCCLDNWPQPLAPWFKLILKKLSSSGIVKS